MAALARLEKLDLREVHGLNIAIQLLEAAQDREGVLPVTVRTQSQAELVSTAIKRMRELGKTKVIVDLNTTYQV